MGVIERWEEKVGRLDEKNKLTDNMKSALICTLCPKKLRDHLELHTTGKREYHTIKLEIVRILDSGVLGRADVRVGADKPPTGMEIDACNVDPTYGEFADAYLSGDLAAMYGKGGGKGGKGGKWGGKGQQGGAQWGNKGGKGGKGDPKGQGGKKGDAGKGGFKGKGESPTEFQGYCSYCTLWGHTQRYCPKRQAEWFGGGGGGKGGAHALEGMEEVAVDQGLGFNDEYEEVKPLGGLGYACTITGSYNTHGCCNGTTPCIHHLLPGGSNTTASPPPVYTSTPTPTIGVHHTAATPLTVRPTPLYSTTPTHNRFTTLYQDNDDDQADVQEIGRLAALTPTVTPTGNNASIMNIGTNSSRPGSVKLKVMGDSGAADCVLPASLFNEVPLKVNGPKVGRKYTAADGRHISNIGVRTLVGTTSEGHKRKIDFEVAEVTKPLASFSKIAKAGHRIILDNDLGQGGYIENKHTGERTQLYLENDVYLFDLYVDIGASAGFARQVAKA